jgi:hypothetical protein
MSTREPIIKTYPRLFTGKCETWKCDQLASHFYHSPTHGDLTALCNHHHNKEWEIFEVSHEEYLVFAVMDS